MAISETKHQGWRVILLPSEGRLAILTSTLAAVLFSSHPKRERDWEAHLNYYASTYNRGRQLMHCKTKLNQIQLECGPMPNMMVALPTTGGAVCSTPQFGWRPLLECRAVRLPRRETRWNLQGCPKLANRSQPLVGRSSPYYEDMWRRYCCLTSFSDRGYVP